MTIALALLAVLCGLAAIRTGLRIAIEREYYEARFVIQKWRERARDARGRFVSDDPNTPEDEAWK